MSTMSPEIVHPDIDSDFSELEDQDWDIPCDIPKIRTGAGWPDCGGQPAQWVAWRPNCCAAGPRYLLVCDHCKNTYQRWAAQYAEIVCGWCGTVTGGTLAYIPLNKRRNAG